jgi:hypothetical protein
MASGSEVFITGAGFSRAISDQMPLLRGLSDRVLSRDLLADPALTGLTKNFELVVGGQKLIWSGREGLLPPHSLGGPADAAPSGHLQESLDLHELDPACFAT